MASAAIMAIGGLMLLQGNPERDGMPPEVGMYRGNQAVAHVATADPSKTAAAISAVLGKRNVPHRTINLAGNQVRIEAKVSTGLAETEAALAAWKITDLNNILSKRSIYFDYNEYEIKPEFRPLLEAHAKYLAANPKASVMLQGNADERGSREYNLSLGQNRAMAVKRTMNILGVPDGQIETVSLGEEKPRCSESSETCWQQNRRTDIVYPGE